MVEVRQPCGSHLERPKSINWRCPSSSNNIFSGFISLYITPALCKKSVIQYIIMFKKVMGMIKKIKSFDDIQVTVV